MQKIMRQRWCIKIHVYAVSVNATIGFHEF